MAGLPRCDHSGWPQAGRVFSISSARWLPKIPLDYLKKTQRAESPRCWMPSAPPLQTCMPFPLPSPGQMVSIAAQPSRGTGDFAPAPGRGMSNGGAASRGHLRRGSAAGPEPPGGGRVLPPATGAVQVVIVPGGKMEAAGGER